MSIKEILFIFVSVNPWFSLQSSMLKILFVLQFYFLHFCFSFLRSFQHHWSPPRNKASAADCPFKVSTKEKHRACCSANQHLQGSSTNFSGVRIRPSELLLSPAVCSVGHLYTASSCNIAPTVFQPLAGIIPKFFPTLPFPKSLRYLQWFYLGLPFVKLLTVLHFILCSWPLWILLNFKYLSRLVISALPNLNVVHTAPEFPLYHQFTLEKIKLKSVGEAKQDKAFEERCNS